MESVGVSNISICFINLMQVSSHLVTFFFVELRYVDPGMAMKKGKVWMLDPDATFKPPGKIKQSFSTKLWCLFVCWLVGWLVGSLVLFCFVCCRLDISL